MYKAAQITACKMSERQLCRLHGVEAISKCLFHGEPMCDECKYDKRHKDCPKDTVPVSAEISAEDLHRKEAHNECCEIYTTALKIRNGSLLHDNDQSAKEVKSNLRLVFKEFKSKVDVLLEDVSSCIDETNSRCKQQIGDVQNDSDRILTEVGKLMKELFENRQDLTKLLQRTGHFQKIVNDKIREERNCDLKSLLILELARLLHQERVVTLPQEIRFSDLIDCLYTPVLNPKLTLFGKLEIEPPYHSDKRL